MLFVLAYWYILKQQSYYHALLSRSGQMYLFFLLTLQRIGKELPNVFL